MVRLVSPNGVVVEASDEAAPALLANGYAPEKAEKPKAAPRKRAAKPKEQ